jgi:hypothetical protein
LPRGRRSIAFGHSAQLAADAYHASLRIAEPTLNIAVGEVRTLDVDVINRSTDQWEWGNDAAPPIHLSYRVHESPGDYLFGVDLVHEHVRWFGQTVDVAVRVRTVGRVGAVAKLPDTPAI